LLVELPEGVGRLLFLFFNNTHQVLAGLPQRADDLAILFDFSLVYSYITHQVLAWLPQGVGGLLI
jgi:hypothetical protein